MSLWWCGRSTVSGNGGPTSSLRTGDVRAAMQAVVERPLTPHDLGRISCVPVGMEEPVDFRWTPPVGVTLHLDESGSEAYDVSIGRYHVRAMDAHGVQTDVTVDVEPLTFEQGMLCIDEYRVTHASSSHARDGRVEAFGYNLWPDTNETSGVMQKQTRSHGGSRGNPERQYLWTNGALTTEPVLNDVPCGTYAMHVLVKNHPKVTVVHRTPPAVVSVQQHLPTAVPPGLEVAVSSTDLFSPPAHGGGPGSHRKSMARSNRVQLAG